MNETIELLQRHRSIRRFTNQPVTTEQIETIIRSAEAASSSSSVQAYSVIAVTDPDKKKELAVLTGNQAWVEQCPIFFVWCADLNRLQKVCELQGQKMIHEPIENFIVATVDVALAAQNAMIAAESMGLGGVFIGGIRNNPRDVVSLLDVPELVYPVFGMCIGYPDQSPSMRPRLPLEAVYHQNTYDSDKVERWIQTYDQTTENYYQERSGGHKSTTWSKEMVNKYRYPFRDHMREFLDEQGFRLQ